MKKIIFSLCVAALLGATSTAMAADSGPFVGLKAGSASKSVNGWSESRSAFGLFGGYAFNKNLSAEVGYTDLGTMLFGTVRITALEISAVGTLPLSDSFSLNGKLGIASTSEKGLGLSASNTSVTYGLSAQYQATPSVGIRLGWDRYKFGDNVVFNKGDSNLYSASVLFSF